MLLRSTRSEAQRLLQKKKVKLSEKPEWKTDPLLFSEEALGLRCWSKQAKVVESITTHKRVAVRSGHKVGKSELLCATALWWASTKENAVVIMTMATGRQIKLILWKALRRMIQRSKVDFPKAPLDPGTGLHFKNGSYIVGFSTDDTENMGGFSGTNVLFIVDEASGVEEEIFEAIEGNLAGGGDSDKSIAKIMLAGNPTRTSGTFFDAFHSGLDIYSCHHISSEDTPNVIANEIVIPGLATADYVRERRKIWGADSPLYQVRVKGNFARQGSNSVIFLDTVCNAVNRHSEKVGEGRLHVGVDVARFGDDSTCIVVRRGQKILAVDVYNKFDEVDIAGFVLETIGKYQLKGEQYPLVKVDTTGIGSGVASILRRNEKIRVYEINSSAKPVDVENFINVRSELWFNMNTWLLEDGAIPDDKELQRELIAPTYHFDAQGRQVVEAKKDMKKRLGHSPDRADALALAIYAAPSAGVYLKDTKQRNRSTDYRFGASSGFG
jgi:hypothetical protein